MKTSSVSIGEATTLLEARAEAVFQRKVSAEILAPVFLWGPPGLGKSSVVRQVTERHHVKLIDVRLAQMDSVDLRGLPTIENGLTRWAANSEFPREGMGILLLDELSHAARAVQTAAYQLVLDRAIGEYRVPPGWIIVAAGNRTQDRSTSIAMSSALSNRFLHVEVSADLESWRIWAANAGIRPDVIGFLSFRPELLHDMSVGLERGWPSPRSWERVSRELDLAEGVNAKPLVRVATEGLVGVGAATEFLAFIEWSARIPDVLQMMTSKIPISIPERPDQKFALVSAMSYHLRNAPDLAEFDKRLTGFYLISLMLTSDFAAMAMFDAVSSDFDDKKGINPFRIYTHPKFREWGEMHGKAFARRYPQASKATKAKT